MFDEIVELRRQRMTYQEIADRIGKSKSYVGLILNRLGQSGYLGIHPIFLDPSTFSKQDDEIAAEVGLSIVTVASIRRKLGFKHKKSVDLQHRRNLFVTSVFPGYKAGPNFSAIRPFVVEHLSQAEASKILDFYFATKDGLSKYSRFARSKVRGKLKAFVNQEVIESMVSEGAICQSPQ